MGRDSPIYQRFAAALGMLSILFLSCALPWCAAFCPAPGGRDALPSLTICTVDRDASQASYGGGVTPHAPGPIQIQCPLCLGLAGLQLAIAAAILLGVAPAILAEKLASPANANASSWLRPLPSSRGPPSLAA
jgi:hypothetical protein